MNYFEYRDNELFCEGVSIAEIAEKEGTPLYVYSYKTLNRHFTVFDNAFEKIPHLVCYSCKANSNIAILRLMGNLGGGIDIVSGGELHRALTSGIPGDRIVFSGVGKTEEEIAAAIKAGILMINVESEGELSVISSAARRMNRRVPVSIRVNPEIDPKTHPYITTGLKRNKFGVIWKDALVLYMKIKEDKMLLPVGISSHIGSQILEMAPFEEAVRSLVAMAGELDERGIRISYLDIGGGLGIAYKEELPPHPEEYARVIEKELEDSGFTVILEPGRVIVGNGGVFITKVLYVKKSSGKTFYVVDGAMNDLLRPSLYDAYHEILPVRRGDGRKIKVDIVGPVCESGDFLAKDREMPVISAGELIAVMGAGAYGFSMSSNYNSRRRSAEALVREDGYYIIRKRETLRDLLRGESIPSFMEV